ncbi:MAG: cobalamin biosynthesis protein [Alphaproteobacteria bacterium]|nr:cobalamin biosynthesis protein [Alphaproteobacteria bacterium]
MPFLFPEATAEILVALVITLALEGYLGGIGGVWRRYPRIGLMAQTLAGRMADKLDRDGLSEESQRFRGGLVLLVILVPTVLLGGGLQILAQESIALWVALVLVMVGTVGQRQAYAELEPVSDALLTGDFAAARRAVDPLTDQDIHGLDEAGVLKAGIEGTVLAHVRQVALPVLAAVLAGLPGLFAVTVITALGRSLPRISSAAFAAPARHLSTALTRIASPVTGLFFAFAAIGGPATHPLAAIRTGLAQRGAGAGALAVATIAGALGTKLGGPRVYAERVVPHPWLNPAAPAPSVHDLRRFQTLYALAAIVSLALLAVLLLVTLTTLP